MRPANGHDGSAKRRMELNIPDDINPLELATLVVSHLVKDFGAEVQEWDVDLHGNGNVTLLVPVSSLSDLPRQDT
jgi:hypothetical protein